jgi:hypothetical protein
VIIGVSLAGCGPRPLAKASSRASAAQESSGSQAVGRPAAPAASQAARQKLLAGALAVLDRFDDFDESRGAELVFDRLAQWSRAAAALTASDWRPDPLVDALPERLRAAIPEPLDAQGFDAAADVMFLRDQRWLADIARVARGDAVDDLAIATNLFDWTVRSLALVSDPPLVSSDSNPGTRWFLPGEILLTGRASPPQRAWIFLDLLRHAGLNGVMLATVDPDRSVRPWLPAVVSGGSIYLFEPAYGMPIAGPDGRGVATVAEAAADPSILAALSLPDRPYRVQAADMDRLACLVNVDPWTASRRMAALDVDLRSARDMRVAVAATATAEQARAALPAAARERPAGVWEFPWETVARRRAGGGAVGSAAMRELAPLQITLVASGDGPEAGRPLRPLYAARLREFRGEWDGPTGAKAAYLAARPGREVIAAAVRGLPPEQADAARRLYGQMKEDAAYWLGVLTLAEGEYEAAIDYLRRMTLESAPDSRWSDAAHVNLAQAYLGLGKKAEAAAALREDRSPQRFGSRLEAAKLEAVGQ